MGKRRGAIISIGSILGTCLCVTGCLYFTDLTGLSGGDTPDAADASSPDGASLDGTSPPTDGATTKPDAEAGASGCDGSTHDFCVDFDDGKLDVPPWSAISRDGTIVVEDGPSVSSPKALHCTLPGRGDVNQVLRDRAFKNWTTPWRAMHVELDIFVVKPAWGPDDHEMNLVEVALISDTTAAGVDLSVGPTGTILIPAKSGEPNINGPAFPFDTWTHVTIDIDPSHYRVTIGNAPPLEATHATVTPGANPNLVAFFGLSSYTDPICAFDARFDNFTVDFK